MHREATLCQMTSNDLSLRMPHEAPLELRIVIAFAGKGAQTAMFSEIKREEHGLRTPSATTLKKHAICVCVVPRPTFQV